MLQGAAIELIALNLGLMMVGFALLIDAIKHIRREEPPKPRFADEKKRAKGDRG